MKITMLCGFPGSGKSSICKEAQYKQTDLLCRDVNGGRTNDLLPLLQGYINKGESVILDATFINKGTRQPFIDLAIRNNVEIECIWQTTNTEDCQINALTRMWDRYGEMFMTAEDIANHKEASNDPNMFPIIVLFKMKKMFENPELSEGFVNIEKRKFTRRYNIDFTQKALFLDFDGTIRDVPNTAQYKFPIKTDEVFVLENRSKVIKDYIVNGYKVYGISNQSGISRNNIPKEDVEACFKETNRQLDIDIEITYCPHNVPPQCYCRKPQVGMFMNYVMRDKIDIKNSIFVGDQTTDKTTATRLGMEFVHADNFFK